MIKNIISLGASIGVGQVMSNIVKVTTPQNANKYVKIITGIGGAIISGIACDLAINYVEEGMDKIKNPFIEEDINEEIQQ